MRILHVVPTYIPAYRYGGPIYAVHGLCKALASRGHDVHVFTTNVDGPNDSDVPLCRPIDKDKVKVWDSPCRHLRRLYWSPPIKGALKEHISGFDILHLHSIFLWPTRVAGQAARRFEVPYVVSPRGMLVKDLIERKSRWLKTAWIHLIERRNLERATALHMTSAVEDREPRRFRFNLPKSQIIPNGIDMPPDTGIHGELSGPVMQALHHQPMILFIGRINWKKGLDKLICAMRQIERGYLVIAGNDEEGYTPFLKQIAETSGVMQRVSFVGPVYGSEKSALLEAASVFPLPSISENFGNAALEAMAVGCTVVVSKETGVADIVRQSGGGVVIDRDALVRNLSTLLSDPSRLKQMGEAARQFVSDNCSWDTVAVKMERFYEVYL